MKYLVSAMLLAFTTVTVNAQMTTTNCQRDKWSMNCTMIDIPLRSSGPLILRRDPLEFDAVADAKWEAFCKPTFRIDGLGMTHYVYAIKGCEYGRSE